MSEKKTISILGVTGSVGRASADVILSAPDRFDVQAVTAHERVDDLADLAVRLGAKCAVIGNEARLPQLRAALAGQDIMCAGGAAAVADAAAMKADIVMAAIVGCAGLLPVLRAVAQGGHVAIANKEPLVVAGPLVMAEAKRSGARILPVDSEHNAVFQLFENDNRAAITRIILTASGGPFRGRAYDTLAHVTPAQAVAHPNWSMGAKISVDSATMMNKALEVIEAHILFDMKPAHIDVVVHPQSIVHSFVEYADGSLLAQMGAPDMRTPIAYALSYPSRMATPGQRLDIHTLSRLDFEQADHDLYPALRLAYAALDMDGGTVGRACLALNVANEESVAAFLSGRIAFTDILPVNEYGMRKHFGPAPKDLEEILNLVETVRADISDYIHSIARNAPTDIVQTG